MRTVISLNNNWCFHKGDIKPPKYVDKGPIYSQSKLHRKKSGPAAYSYLDKPDQYVSGNELIETEHWEYVDLPHDYIIKQDTDKNENSAFGFLRYDNAWYRKHFSIPENCEGKRFLIRFFGIAGNSEIYLNGCFLYHNYSSYNTFEIDISDLVLKDRENVLAVYVNTENFEGWWYQGGGIYRDVQLVITDSPAIDLWGVYAPVSKKNDELWQIDFSVTVVNSEDEERNVTVKSCVVDANGATVSEACGSGVVPWRGKAEIRYAAEVKRPLLWNCESPNLYTVKTAVFANGRLTDETETVIGFRTVEFDAERGFLLNGKRMFIKGVCAHQDFGITGLAVTENIAEYKMRLIKEMGANGYRTSHYQHTAAYLDACDKLGILVVDEIRRFETNDYSLKCIESLVKRDRNRPSVILWSTSNEEPSHLTDVGRRLHKTISMYIKRLDPSRKITLAQDTEPQNSTVYGDCDVLGINYNLRNYEEVHKKYPDKPIFASECCATGTTRDWNFASNKYGRITDSDARTNSWFGSREETWKFLMSKPYVFGAFQWTAFEHRGEAVWPAICSKSGAIDLFLQKKGAFYQNQSHWLDKPMVHIVNHWNFIGLENEEIFVTVYTNCEEIELFLNNFSLGKKKIEKYGHGLWKVPYTPGEISVTGYNGGVAVCRHYRKTAGKPVKLNLTLDNSFKPNGRDVALFTCECIDEYGITVPDATEFVRFSVNAPAQILGTGSDNTDCRDVTLPERKMYAGKIRIAVKPVKGQEYLELIAYSDNCGVKRWAKHLV